MKKLLILAVFVITTGSLTAQNKDSIEQKIGYVSSEKLIREIPDFTIMNKKISKLKDDQFKKLKIMRDKFSRKMEAFQRDIYKLRNEEIAARQGELNWLSDNINEFQEQMFVEIGELEKQMWDSIETKFQRVIEEFAVTNGYTLIFDTTGDKILYKNFSATDINDLVLPEIRHAY